eukprot:518317_1
MSEYTVDYNTQRFRDNCKAGRCSALHKAFCLDPVPEQDPLIPLLPIHTKQFLTQQLGNIFDVDEGLSGSLAGIVTAFLVLEFEGKYATKERHINVSCKLNSDYSFEWRSYKRHFKGKFDVVSENNNGVFVISLVAHNENGISFKILAKLTKSRKYFLETMDPVQTRFKCKHLFLPQYFR